MAQRLFASNGTAQWVALDLGLRHDGGDAETGTRVEVGGRIRYTDAGSGLTVEANARTLVAHEDSGNRIWRAGARGSLAPHLAMSLDGTRRARAGDDAPEHGVQFRLTLRW